MGSHYSALLVIDPPAEMEIKEFLDELTGRKHELFGREFQESDLPSGDCIGVRRYKGITFIQGPILFGMENESELRIHLQGLSTQLTLFHWTVEDTSGTLAFDYLEKGVLKRSWWSCDGAVSSSKGAPLAGEAQGKFAPSLSVEELSGIWEWDVISVAESFGFAWVELTKIPSSLYRPTESESCNKQSGGKKPWWKLW